MPINQTVWKITNGIEQIQGIKLDYEKDLEEILQTNIEIINENWLVIGRQVLTKYQKYIDLLAIDTTGSIVIIELKRDKTPREVVAQALDYASYIKNLTADEISNVYEQFRGKHLKSSKSLNEIFFEKFEIQLDDDIINSSHQIIIVAAELDSSTERIVSYLNESNVPINIVFFKVFNINNEKYINRAWYIDPYETSDIATVRTTKEPWNNEYYISFGVNENRNWEDAIKYGFISAGGGTWYTRTLGLLNIGDRIWVNIPHVGYVGVGKVIDTVHKADEKIFTYEGKEVSIYDLQTIGSYHKKDIDNDDKAEYIVKIEWIKTSDMKQAVSEVGFFGNQNTVCKPTSHKWNHTIERLKDKWDIK